MTRKRTGSPKAQVDPEAETSLRQHLCALGLGSTKEYKEWCRQHGFSSHLYKGSQQQQRERLVVARLIATAKLAESSKKPNFSKIIADAFTGSLRPVESRSPWLSTIWRVSETASKDRHVKAKLLDLLLHVQSRTEFLDTATALPQLGHWLGNTWIDGLLALAHSWRLWQRPIEEWTPRTHNTRRQFASLARHLLAEYPVPTFMDAVWFMGVGEAAIQRQRWFSHIGMGNNIRTTDTPIPLTKRMAHYFMQAPGDCTVGQALRWGQVLGLGGSSRLARTIMASRLGEHFGDDDFWITVIRFFIEKRNVMPDAKGKDILRRWAAQEGLRLGIS